MAVLEFRRTPMTSILFPYTTLFRSLMCTLLHRPRILFLDEPTNGVDPLSRRDFWAILYQLLQYGITIFMTTVYLDEAERANRVGLLHQGRLIRCDTPEVLKGPLPSL